MSQQQQQQPQQQHSDHHHGEENNTKIIHVSQIPVWADSSKDLIELSDDFNPELNQKISLYKGDITTLDIDVIVNSAHHTLEGYGGVDGAIHRVAGPKLREECMKLNGCKVGEAKITKGYGLPAKHVIHTVGPIGLNEFRLEMCYRNSLNLMKENGLKTIAFPCISTGIFGFPNIPAAKVALKTIRAFLEAEDNIQHVDRIVFCTYLQEDFEIYQHYLSIYFPTH